MEGEGTVKNCGEAVYRLLRKEGRGCRGLGWREYWRKMQS